MVSVPDESSLPPEDEMPAGWERVIGVRGAAAQRNVGIDALGQADIVFFFDDDAVIRRDYIANAVNFFNKHPDVVALTGRVIADGKLTGEIEKAASERMISASEGQALSGRWRYGRELYGANFAVRLGSVPDIRFDDRLPLYSWLEDHDLARRLLKYGALARVDDCLIVHRAAASGGRQNHLRLGYSQVMNPVYLARKGSFPIWLAAQQLLRPVTKNIASSLWRSSSMQWRRERLLGNAVAACDILRGRISPERITDLARPSLLRRTTSSSGAGRGRPLRQSSSGQEIKK